MGIRVILLVVVLLRGERGLIQGQGVVGGEGDDDCCPFITVNVGGSYANLNGDYTLIQNKESKPEEVCINGCIYTKVGSPLTKAFCFKADSSAAADVKCPVGIGLFLIFN